MNEIAQFVKAICRSFDMLDGIKEEDQKLPPRKELEEVCHILNNVSCLKEENRFPSFRTCFIPPDSELLDMYVYSHALLFDHPILFNAFELHKLAPALNRNMSYLMLDIRNRPFRMVGLIASYTAWEKIMIREITTGTRMPRIPNIAVTGPGKLEACFGESPIVSYNAGSCVYYRTDTFTSTVIADQLREGSHVPDDERLSVLYRIIRDMKGFGHGGQIYIVPSAEACQDLMNIKYRLPCKIGRAHV